MSAYSQHTTTQDKQHKVRPNLPNKFVGYTRMFTCALDGEAHLQRMQWLLYWSPWKNNTIGSWIRYYQWYCELPAAHRCFTIVRGRTSQKILVPHYWGHIVRLCPPFCLGYEEKDCKYEMLIKQSNQLEPYLVDGITVVPQNSCQGSHWSCQGSYAHHTIGIHSHRFI